jgi:predicted dehydrogenase
MTSPRKTRVLQVGCGGITGAWFSPATQMDDLEYAGLCDLNIEAARKRRDEFNLPSETPIFSDLATAIQETRPDCVFDCTIPSAHTPTALLAFEGGAHVLSEKPMSDTMEQARRALDAAVANGRVYAITQNYRYAQGPRRLKAFLESGALGDVTTINADMFLGAHFGGFRDEMRHVLLLDMAIHTFDMARFLSGADALSVFCREWNPRGSWYAGEASASAIFEMSEGVAFNFRGSWCAPGLPTGFGAHWRIIGTRGSLLWDANEGFECEVEDGDEGFFRPVKILDVPDGPFAFKAQGHGGLIREFLSAVQNRASEPETSGADNIKSLLMTLGAVESSQARRLIELG